MNTPDEPLRVAAKAWLHHNAVPGGWRLDKDLRAALEAAIDENADTGLSVSAAALGSDTTNQEGSR